MLNGLASAQCVCWWWFVQMYRFVASWLYVAYVYDSKYGKYYEYHRQINKRANCSEVGGCVGDV